MSSATGSGVIRPLSGPRIMEQRSIAEWNLQLPGYYYELVEPGTVLLVDDVPAQLESLRMQMKAFWPNWQVIGETTPQAAMQRLRSLAEPGSHLPNLVSVDLGLPPDANRPWVGLKLLKEIQHNFGGIRLVVHSSLAVVDEVMHTILAVPASYVQIRDSESVLAYAMMMPFLARGYLVYSSTPGSQFPRAVVTAPDPLSHDDWELLALIAQTDPRLTLEDIAERLHVDTSRISQRVRTIAQRLDPQFIQVDSSRTYEPHKFRPKLEEFYRSYCARYGRS